MSRGPIRRSQLIAPFGVGAIYTTRNGQSLISAGLDHWFEKEGNNSKFPVDVDEFKIGEWRLERALRVNHFRLPADYRLSNPGQNIENAYITQPFLRFPTWHYCGYKDCHRLEKKPLTGREQVRCDNTGSHSGKQVPMKQSPYVCICPNGHIQDFPYVEWVHRSLDPVCKPRLRMDFSSSGTGGTAGTFITCDECKARRGLGGILGADESQGGKLSDIVTVSGKNEQGLSQKGDPYLCMGYMPWLGNDSKVSVCGEKLIGAMKSSSNVYFPLTASSIYIPRGEDSYMSGLIAIVEKPKMRAKFNGLIKLNLNSEQLIGAFKDQTPISDYPDEDVKKAMDIAFGDDVLEEEPEGSFQRQEYLMLINPKGDKDLEIREIGINEYQGWMAEYFQKIMLVDRLRETRALRGFSRVFEENNVSTQDLKAMLRANTTNDLNSEDNWLPAYVVFGEGIFFQFKEEMISQWEQKPSILNRLESLLERYRKVQQERHSISIDVSNRLVLMHTFAHILINSLSFSCGYGSAALKERLYVSEGEDPMSGVLIYTASGDQDGSMGGLVRMGKPGFIEPIIASGLNRARWCSSDPTCMEIGSSAGQGPDSCNLAACHNCSLLAETSCQMFNKLLDRATLVGSIEDENLGIFGNLLHSI